MNKIFNYLQFLVVPFSFAAIYFIYHGSIDRGENFMDDIGTGVLCMGIAFAFGSMGDMTKISKKEAKLFSNAKKYKKSIKFFVWFGFFTFLVCCLFIAMKWLGTEAVADDYYNLGLNLFPVVIAIFFNIKQMQDKKQYFDLKNSDH